MKSEVFLLDCMEGMKQYPDKYFDLAVCDPPYGINAANMTMGSNPNRKGRDELGKVQYGGISVAQKLKKGKLNRCGKNSVLANRALSTMNCDWDFYPPTQEYFTHLIRVSKHQIIWGGNYFTDKIPVSRGWVCWDKRQPWDNFSQFELAWTSFDVTCKLFSFSNKGGANNEDKIHPTQKPVTLYDWIYAKYLPHGGKVLDTHLGSGSNRIAADKAGNIEFTAFEIDKDYFEAQEERFRLYKSQLKLAI